MIQGCGLSDATEIQGEYVLDAWSQALAHEEFYDLITLGNHDEMIDSSVAVLLEKLQQDEVRGKFVSYNTFASNGAISQRMVLRTYDSMRLLITGLMYDMSTAEPLSIINFNKELNTTQFYSMLNAADAVIFLVHIGLNQHREMYDQLYELVRSHTSKPVIILGGHEHQSAYEYGIRTGNSAFVNPFRSKVEDPETGLDMNVIYMETENYYKNLTLLDFEVKDGMLASVHRELVQCNKKKLMDIVGIEEETEFDNAYASEIQKFVDEKVEELQLLDVIGQSPDNYFFLEPDVHNTSSIWNLWMQDIVPKVLYEAAEKAKLKNEKVNLIGTSFFNNDIYKGDVNRNDLYVTVPYLEEFFYDYPEIKGSELKAIFCDMVSSTEYPGCPKAKGPERLRSPTGFPKYFLSVDIDQIADEKLYSLILTDYDFSRFSEKAEKLGINVVKDDGRYTDMSPFDVYEQYVKTEWAH